jgi:large subunit ribosomal protein L21
MYAIIGVMGYQYKVEVGETLKVPYMKDKEVGSEVEIYDVLLKHDNDNLEIGTPTVPNSKVLAEVIGSGNDKKVIVFKKKRRNGYRRKKGHRQQYTEIKIKEIL